MKKYNIDVDMDHVLADFQKSYNLNWKKQQQFPQAEARFFDELDPIYSHNKSNIDYIKDLIQVGHFIRIVTAPSIENINCWTGKAFWIRKYFGKEMLKKLIITYDKSLTSFSADIIIDDSILNGQSSYKNGHILYGSIKYPTMKEVYNEINNWSINNKIL